ncbi:tetratricopeptide repeat protein [Azotobacter bryophylli]|uniref:Tetratricopeptide repeat protein n=1 Tax=Azotobacter bryophylli TaxID=1986537 RepID=A0ABV7AXX4_9GAMM
MKKWLIGAAVASTLLGGCASVDRGAIPVVEESGTVFDEQEGRGPVAVTARQPVRQARPVSAEDSGVVVMVPSGASRSAPIQASRSSSMPIGSAPVAPVASQPISAPVTAQPSYVAPSQPTAVAPPSAASGGYVSRMPTGIPSGGSVSGGALAADEQLDGPVLALLTTAKQQQSGGDLNSAASSLERAQRIAPREPQVLYRLAEVRLAQGDDVQAEQLARRALTYSSGRPALQASLWSLIAQARERQGDPAGAAQARERARVVR